MLLGLAVGSSIKKEEQNNDENPNWYLPLALGLNCIALFLNGAQRRKQKKEDERKA